MDNNTKDQQLLSNQVYYKDTPTFKTRRKSDGNKNKNNILKDDYKKLDAHTKKMLLKLKPLIVTNDPIVNLDANYYTISTFFPSIKRYIDAYIHNIENISTKHKDIELSNSSVKDNLPTKEAVDYVLKALHPKGKVIRTPKVPVIVDDKLTQSILKANKTLVGETFTELVGNEDKYSFTTTHLYSANVDQKVYMVVEDITVYNKESKVEKSTYVVPYGEPNFIKLTQKISTIAHLPLDILDDLCVNYRQDDNVEEAQLDHPQVFNLKNYKIEKHIKFDDSYDAYNYKQISTEYQDYLKATVFAVKHILKLPFVEVDYNKLNANNYDMYKELYDNDYVAIMDNKLADAKKLAGYIPLTTVFKAFRKDTNTTDVRISDDMLNEWDKGRSKLYPSWYKLPSVGGGLYEFADLKLVDTPYPVVQHDFKTGQVGVDRKRYYKQPDKFDKMLAHELKVVKYLKEIESEQEQEQEQELQLEQEQDDSMTHDFTR